MQIRELPASDYVELVQQLAGSVYDFSVGDETLDKPVTLHIPYELEDGHDPYDLSVIHQDGVTGQWEEVGGIVDESTGTIRVVTSELSGLIPITHAIGEFFETVGETFQNAVNIFSPLSGDEISTGCAIEKGALGSDGKSVVPGGGGGVRIGDAIRAKMTVQNKSDRDVDNVFAKFTFRHAKEVNSKSTMPVTLRAGSTEEFISGWYGIYDPLNYRVLCEAKHKNELLGQQSPVMDDASRSFRAAPGWTSSRTLDTCTLGLIQDAFGPRPVATMQRQPPRAHW